jgi:alpha-ketoglutarate-dependent taurine dioxygenase
MLLTVRNLSETIGAEVRNNVHDLLRPEMAAQVRQLLVDRGVLVFPELKISDADQVAFAGLLGNVRQEGEKGIFKVTLDRHTNAHADYLKGSFLWHVDGTHDSVPIFASILSGRVLSSKGGETSFASSYAAYEELSGETKQRIEGLRVVHSFAVSMRRAGVEMTPETESHWKRIPDQIHSLVWTHKTGRKSLVLGCHASHIAGMDRAASDALLGELLAWITQPRFVYRHEWSQGDMLIWDNTGVLHKVEPYPLDCGRLMHRTTLLGEEAFA